MNQFNWRNTMPDVILARLSTEELIIGTRAIDNRFLCNCISIDIEIDEDKHKIFFTPMFGILSDDFIEVDTDLILYETSRVNSEVIQMYKEALNAHKDKSKDNSKTVVDFKSKRSKKY